ncbi:hypothetical protein C8R41DRAFT_926679 [Lentinula lateritia]|uniref:Uncharacterized protein n=1 Tax=Lentinula lateritia TaxID=40482 RepID=A0ABQ8V2F6_9AGAR|nr:hypothetical protein C8R41DRAFT_926679 [Lentinula lateritia]
MPRNKHALFSKHQNKNSRSRFSSATATDQLHHFSRKAKPKNTGDESDGEEMGDNNSEEEPEDSHVAQVLRNITQKGKGSSTLARKAVVASIKASSASSSKLSKAKEETNRTKSGLLGTTPVQEAEAHTEFKVMSLSIYPVGTYLVEEGYFPRQKPTKVYHDLTSLVDIGCAQIATISQPIVFDRKDTYEEVTDRLRALCPLVMEYANSQFMYRKKSNPEYPKHDSDPAHAYLPEIILCKKDRTYGMLLLTGPSSFFPDGEMLWRIATKHGSANTNALTREPISKGRLSLFQEAIQKGKQMNVPPITAFYTLEENTELSTENKEEEEEEEVTDGSKEVEENTSDKDQKDYQEDKETEVEVEEIVNKGAVSGNSEEEEELVEGALRPPFTQKRLRSESEPSGQDERPSKKRKGNGLRSYSGSSSEPQTEEAEEDTTNTPKPRSRAFLRQTGSPHMRSILRNADRARKLDEVEDDLGFRTDYSSDREYASNLFEKPTSSTPQVNTSAATVSTSQASTSTSNPSNSMAAFLTYYKPPLSDKSRERLDPWKQV